MLSIKNDAQRKAEADLVKGKKEKRFESLEDDQELTRMSLIITAEDHRRYKTFLAQNKLKMKNHLNDYIKKCIKDID